ncbi:MAG TPA: hypothetical protein VNN78_02745, partial [Burkholderiales bacterium]|nr:hypothetical protein [Burkholderiales bacterium]
MFKALKRKFGIAAPRMAVHAQVAWYWRWLGMVLMVALILVLAWWMYDSGRKFAGFDSGQAEREMARQAELNARLQMEDAALRQAVAASERQLQIERSTYGDLAKQVKDLS